LWSRTGLVTVEVAEPLSEGWKLWLRWKNVRAAKGDDSEALRADIQVLEKDQGRYMGFLRMIART
jgi:hypothetical protein